VLQEGSRLGAFEIAALIGAGGMGQVYRARDTRLNRDVAIKVLPESVVHDPDRLARFEREAKVLATLNHPLIAQVYGFEESGDMRAIVMELVEGWTLEERIAQGPMPVADALHIARQLAEALETAHELGVIHRDLKPANIKLTMRGARAVRSEDGRAQRRLAAADVSDCTVKVLDFGLAKATDMVPGAGDALNSPTLTNRATEIGTILGTAAYMAPEQARGKSVDRRADVWAFGVVVYEMLTGARLFKGEDISDTMAAVLRQSIDFGALPPATPPAVRTLLERCLERDARQRLRDIGEARVALERAIAAPPAGAQVTESAAAASVARVRRWLPWVLFAAAAAALVVVLGPRARPAQPEAPARVTRLVSTLGVPGSLVVDAGPAAVLSPDGRAIVLLVRRDNITKLYVRRLDQLEATELAGTENATNPFFSPDGSQIGFFASKGLKTMPAAGGAATTLTDAGTGRGAAWDANGEIIFQFSLLPQSPLVRITAAGARTDRGTTLGPEETTHRWPQILPDGKLLYSGNSDVSAWDRGNVRVETQPGAPGKIVWKGGYHARFVPTGHLLYVHSGTLYGVRFDLDRLEVTSPAVPLIGSVVATPGTGGAQYSVASDGTLAYVPGQATSADSRLYWMTADGKTSALKTAPAPWGNPRISPDGKRIALQVAYGSHDQIAIYDWETDRLTQLTFDAANHRFPNWTPDGQGIVYSADAGGANNIYWRRADGTGQAERLTTSPNNQTVASVHTSGRFIMFVEAVTSTQGDLMVLPLEGSPRTTWAPGPPRPLVNTPAYEALGAFSPDGRLVAYMSSEQGTFEVFVRPFEREGGPWRVSTDRGAHPVWSKTNELLYTSDDQIMTVPYRYDGKVFTHEAPRPWSPVRYATAGPTRKYDLHPDGRRAIVASPDTTGATTYDTIVFVFNFFDELRRLLPPGK
jgi:serine/threonine-protein kinase